MCVRSFASGGAGGGSTRLVDSTRAGTVHGSVPLGCTATGTVGALRALRALPPADAAHGALHARARAAPEVPRPQHTPGADVVPLYSRKRPPIHSVSNIDDGSLWHCSTVQYNI